MGSGLVVEGVIAGSPAEASGIEIGDLVTHLNGRTVSSKDYGDVREALMGTGQVRVSLRRGEQTFERTLTLRRLI